VPWDLQRGHEPWVPGGTLGSYTHHRAGAVFAFVHHAGLLPWSGSQKSLEKPGLQGHQTHFSTHTLWRRADFDCEGCKHDSGAEQGDAPGCVSQHGQRVDDEMWNADAAQHDHESENGRPDDRLLDRFREFGCEHRAAGRGGRWQMLRILDGALSLRIFPCRIESEKENRDGYGREVDDETGHRDRNGAGPSEQIAEDG
jgi:hypothetical protein